jgi:cell division septation protein DedD
MERSYLEVKVSFLHIVVLLAGVILIGSFLFYLGYQAGKSSTHSQTGNAELLEGSNQPEEIQLADVGSNTKKKKKTPDKKISIQDELKLHQFPEPKVEQPKPKKQEREVKTKPIKKETYWAVQVGAFSDYSNAKNYSSKFAKMGYPTEILTTVNKKKKLFRVRVGNFETRAAAQQEMKKLEKTEKRKFATVRSK